MSDLTAPAAQSGTPSGVPVLRRPRRPPACTTRRTTRTPAASPSWPTSAAGGRARSSPQGLTALHNLDHRGAAGAEPNSGDGAGHPDPGPRRAAARQRRLRPAAGRASTPSASRSCPPTRPSGPPASTTVAKLADEEGLTVLGWRDVPVDPDGADLGPTARAVMPHFAQLFVAETMAARADAAAFGGNVALQRRRPGWSGAPSCCASGPSGRAVDAGSSLYFASLSSRTITYKGMLTTDQLPAFFPDLRDERYESAIALVHSRFSTNTFPSWPLAHPFRFIAHNGEINTIKGNRNRMRAREAKLATELFDGPAGPASELGLDRIFPVTASDFSDSATFDEVLELLHLSGRLAAARGADDDPGGVGEPRRDGPGPPGLLPVPLLDHGAVGRPGRASRSPTAR